MKTKPFVSVFAATMCYLFMTACAQSPFPGHTKSATGFYYKNHTNLKGPKAQAGDRIEVAYALCKGDSIIESSFTSGMTVPIVFPDAATMKREMILQAVQLLSVGDSLTAHFPFDSVKATMRGLERMFGPNEYITFRFKAKTLTTKAEMEAEQIAAQQEAVKVQARAKEVEAATKQIAADYQAGKLSSRLQATPEGLKYLVVEQGSGPKPVKGNNVKVHYCGVLTDGTRFDMSFERGSPIPFQIGTPNIIQGWNIGVPQFNQGGKGYLFIPYPLAYGERGNPPTIPAKAELIFYIELTEVK